MTVDKADTLAIEALDWNDVTLRAPALDALPRLSCLLAPALDVKCGLKVLRQGGQMATEILAGAWDDTLSLPVRWGAVGLLASALADVETHLPGWALEGETRALRTFFEKELEALRSLALAEGAMEAPIWWKADDALRRARLKNLPKVLESSPVSAEARIALLRTTALPPQLWQRLTEGKKNRTTDHKVEDTVKDFEGDRP